MLAVDVSFLVAPGVVVGSRSVTTVAIYMSLLTVIGSLLSTALLARQRYALDDSNRGVVRWSTWCPSSKTLFLPNLQMSFMYAMTRRGGPKALGIMYSLPFTLLIWAYVLSLLTVILRQLTQLTELQDDFLRDGIILRHFWNE